jgi:eukaryotic-like serine/threonine-protein kinase
MPQHAVKREQFGSYELLAPLAVGGTSELYLARIVGEAGFEKIVVVKQLLPHLAEDDEFVDMFLDEARLGSHLHHTNIVQTLELGKFGGRYFIAMEYVAGLTLAQTAAKAAARVSGGLPLELVAGIVEQACAGLHYAHELKLPDGTALQIVHRDVSPQNLIITFEGEVKLVDFGIAHAAVREAKTKAGMIKGKFAYMAPEQCLGNPVDRRADLFALGVVLWECATGQRLFKRKTTYETYQAIVQGEVPAPSRINPRVDAYLEQIIVRALCYRPEDRFATAEELGDALERWRHQNGMRVTGLDLARFYERHFQPELEEHGARLRQVLSGGAGNEPVAAAPLWHGEEIEVSEPAEAADRPPFDLEALPLPAPQRTPLGILRAPAEWAMASSQPLQVVPTTPARDPTPVLPATSTQPVAGAAPPTRPTPRQLPTVDVTPVMVPTPADAGRDAAPRGRGRGNRVYFVLLALSLLIGGAAVVALYHLL